MSRKRDKEALRCSFCGKPKDEVRKLIAGPSVWICNECVDICNEIVADDQLLEARRQPAQYWLLPARCPHCDMPLPAPALHTDAPKSE